MRIIIYIYKDSKLASSLLQHKIVLTSLIDRQEFGNIESPIYARLQQFFATIFTRFVFRFFWSDS
jgi:hypothetical protein